MKKNIIAIAVVAVLTMGQVFAQKGYNQKGYNYTEKHLQKNVGEYGVEQLDRIVDLSRKQEKEINKIEKKYDKLADKNRKSLGLQGLKKLEQNKNQEILEVLNRDQYNRLMAFEKGRKTNHYDARPRSRG